MRMLLQPSGHVLLAERVDQSVGDDFSVSVRVEHAAGVDLPHGGARRERESRASGPQS
jgi:hypothetical protein